MCHVFCRSRPFLEPSPSLALRENTQFSRRTCCAAFVFFHHPYVEMGNSVHELASKGDVEGVRKFLQKSASKVDKTNRDGQTALHCGAKGGHVEVCRELIASVGSVDAQDKQHRTPLRLAVENNKPQVVRVLCEAGALTSVASSPDKRTPLHLAARDGFTECAEILVEHGAVLDGNPDKWGHLPDEDCAVSEIRILIRTARKDRAAAKPRSYNPQAATAPQLKGGCAGDGPADLPPSYHEATSPNQNVAPERKEEHHGAILLSPLSLARKAGKVGGDCCAGCNAPERSRQLTPCHHIVCGACARHAREEEEEGCPVCHVRVFDDNPLFM